MTDRDVDFIEIRSKYRSKFSWPLNIFFGIAAFEPVQNVYNFIAHGTLLVTSFIPFEIRIYLILKKSNSHLLIV